MGSRFVLPLYFLKRLMLMSETAVPMDVPKEKPKNKASGYQRQFGTNNLAGYLFISPWLICFFLFTLVPMLISLWLAFTDYDLLGDWEFIGLANFERMFLKDIRYARSISATFQYV